MFERGLLTSAEGYHRPMLTSRSSIASRARRAPVRAASVMVLAAGLALAACGSPSKAPPKQAVGQSLGSISDQSSISVRISLGLTPSQIQQLSKKDGSQGMTSAQANALSQGSIFFDVQTGHGEKL